MSTVTIVGIAFALAMDAFAASMASGAIIRKNKLRKALLFGTAFGGFQILMPVLGWLSGLTFRERVSGVDHWLSFGLLAVIGGKMIFESFKIENMEDAKPQMTGVVLLGLAVATSIDAFVVGIGFSFLKVSILLPVAVIGIVTFFMSFAGVFLGSKLGDIMGKKVEFLGGLILLIIGLKILLQHLYAAY